MAKPPIVSAEEWQSARDDLLVYEKEATHFLDAVAARRRRLPMVAFRNDYVFEGLDGPSTLLELFGKHDELPRLHLVHGQRADQGSGVPRPRGRELGDHLGHADRTDQELRGEARLDLAVLLVARHDVLG
jgi:predicted dithiol-disulfide oxidoreductase (DUF899 family)